MKWKPKVRISPRQSSLLLDRGGWLESYWATSYISWWLPAGQKLPSSHRADLWAYLLLLLPPLPAPPAGDLTGCLGKTILWTWGRCTVPERANGGRKGAQVPDGFVFSIQPSPSPSLWTLMLFWAKTLKLFHLATVVWFLFLVSAKHPLGHQCISRQGKKPFVFRFWNKRLALRLIHQWFLTFHIKIRFEGHEYSKIDDQMFHKCDNREHPQWLSLQWDIK